MTKPVEKNEAEVERMQMNEKQGMPVSARTVGITETVLRDAHQSRMATRMRLEEMLPVTEIMDEVGYHSLEVWGGATFDTCMRFLDEDPWDRLRVIRKHFKKTNNAVGYINPGRVIFYQFVSMRTDYDIRTMEPPHRIR